MDTAQFNMKDALDAMFGGFANGSILNADPEDVHEVVRLVSSDPERAGRALGLAGTPTPEALHDMLLDNYYDMAASDPAPWDRVQESEVAETQSRYAAIAARTGVPLDEVFSIVEDAYDGDTARYDSLMESYYRN